MRTYLPTEKKKILSISVIISVSLLFTVKRWRENIFFFPRLTNLSRQIIPDDILLVIV